MVQEVTDSLVNFEELDEDYDYHDNDVEYVSDDDTDLDRSCDSIGKKVNLKINMQTESPS